MFKKKSIYIILIIILFLPLSYKPYRNWCYNTSADFFFPFFSMINKLFEFPETQFNFRKTKSELMDEVRSLTAKNHELMAKNSYLKEYQDENEKLRQLLNLRPVPDYNYIYAEIINRDPVNWYKQFVINKGADDGIKEGALVLVQGKSKFNSAGSFAVIGRTGNVSKHTSVVYTLLSEECRLSVTIPENGATGILRGGEIVGKEILTDLELLPKNLTYKAGSTVVTSGLTSLSPKGLLIGTIDDFKPGSISKDKLFVNLRVKAAADFHNLDYILVLTEKK